MANMSEAQIDAAREKAAELRNVAGGVVGQFTPKEIVVEAKVSTSAAVTTTLKVPAGKFLYGAYIKNPDNDLTYGASATLKLTVGSTDVINATAASSLKGSGVAVLDASPDYSATERAVKLTAGTADLTGGKLIIGVIYG